MARYEEFTYEDYVESEAVRRAAEALNNHLASAPGAYQSRWDGQITSSLNSILNREKFNYDFNADPLYQQYKDRYVKQGRLAMQNTVGQASALTGGYGNSWAATAGSQAYQSYLEGLNDVLPDLYAMAAERYDQEGADLLNRYSVLANQEAVEYGRYRDTVADYQTDRDYLAGRYDSERDFDYGVYSDDRNLSYTAFNDQRNYEFQQQRAAAEDAQWAAELAFRQAQAQTAADQWAAEMAFQQQRAAIEDSRYSAQTDVTTSGGGTATGGSTVTGEGAITNYPASGGVALSPELMDEFEGYLNAGELDIAEDMLETFIAGGVRDEDIEECMRLINGYYNSVGSAPDGYRGISSGLLSDTTIAII